MCQKLYRSRCGQVVVLVFLGLLFNLCTAQANDLPRANAMRTVTPVRSSGGGTLAELRDSRNPPAETPRLNIKGSAQLDRLQACDDRLAEYRQLAHALNQASCNRFGEEKYARLLKSRNEPCRGMPQDAVAVDGYKAVDNAMRGFADRCVCRKLVEAQQANANLLQSVADTRCLFREAEYDMAVHNLVLIDKDWGRNCAGIASGNLSTQYATVKTRLSGAQNTVGDLCKTARPCVLALESGQSAIKTLEAVRADNCRGKLHEALAVTETALNSAAMQCATRAEALDRISEFRARRTSVVLFCSSEEIVMTVRCPYTMDRTIELHKKTVTYSKDITIRAREHWCKHEGDFPWCEAFGYTRVQLEKNGYLLGGDKDIQMQVKYCLPPSEWSKCKAYTSSGDCIPR